VLGSGGGSARGYYAASLEVALEEVFTLLPGHSQAEGLSQRTVVIPTDLVVEAVAEE